MSKEIEISISPTGDVKVDALNFDGKGCTDAVKIFEQAMQGPVKDRQYKPEYYKTRKAGVRHGTR